MIVGFAIEGAEDSETLIIDDLKNIKFNGKDILLGASASGGAPYVIAGLEYAKSLGCKTIALATNKDTKIGKVSDVAIEAEVGPEVITGSTRMKSGTAQKLIFNMISTSVMIKLGKVYDNLMVDVRASNIKLKKRAIWIVKEFVSNSETEVEEVLVKTNYNVKQSIIILKFKLSLEDSKKYLKDENKSLREVFVDIEG